MHIFKALDADLCIKQVDWLILLLSGGGFEKETETDMSAQRTGVKESATQTNVSDPRTLCLRAAWRFKM